MTPRLGALELDDEIRAESELILVAEVVEHPPVAKSIVDFGWQQPIVVDSDMVIIAGHTRYQAALLLELDEVPVPPLWALSRLSRSVVQPQ